MRNYYRNVLVTLLTCILNTSDAFILIRFRRVYEHFLKNRESSIARDPLEQFELQKRIQLCDDVLNARQFMTHYSPGHKKLLSGERQIKMTKWELEPGETRHVLNYQRSYSTRHGGRDSPVLQYSSRRIRTGGHAEGIIVKRIPCVRTNNVGWSVTFGLVDEYMYLFEQVGEKADSRIRLVGILEPHPLSDNRSFEHFRSQHEKYRDEMESICLLKTDDHLRLCSAVLDTLDHLGSLTRTIGRTIHVKYKDRPCILKDIRMGGETSSQYFLRCAFIFEDGSESSSLFYTLADSSEEGAVFIFVEGEHGLLELHGRMVKVGALVNPTGETAVQLIANKYKRNWMGEMIRNNNFVSWRELQKLKNEKDQRRYSYYKTLAGSSRGRSQTKLKAERTRQTTSASDEKKLECRTINRKRSRRIEKNPDKHIISSKKRHMGYSGRREVLAEEAVSEKQKQKCEENEYQKYGLEVVSDSSAEDYEQISEDRTRVLEEPLERNDRKLLELAMVAQTFAEHNVNDITNKSETPTPSTNPPQSKSRRAKRSRGTFD